jgi:integration host factor subunit alpha
MGSRNKLKVGAKDITAFLANALHVSKREAADATRDLLKMFFDTFIHGGDVTLRGLGRFSVKVRGPRMGRNPRTGEAVPVGQRRTVVFRPAKALKDLPIPVKSKTRKG